MYQLTLTPNRDPGPAPYVSLVRYVREGDHVMAERFVYHLWPSGWALVTYSLLKVSELRHEHAGPTIRHTSRMSLIADGLLRSAEGKRWRKSMKALTGPELARA